MKKNNETVTKLRTGDEVVVIAGKDIGKKGTVQKISKFKEFEKSDVAKKIEKAFPDAKLIEISEDKND